jgi:hypothetical protein
MRLSTPAGETAVTAQLWMEKPVVAPAPEIVRPVGAAMLGANTISASAHAVSPVRRSSRGAWFGWTIVSTSADCANWSAASSVARYGAGTATLSAPPSR